MSSLGRSEELKAALDRELSSQPDRGRRLLWLVDHLVEYVDRFTGIATTPSVSMREATESDLFAMVDVAFERLCHERSHSTVSPPFRWESALWVTAW